MKIRHEKQPICLVEGGHHVRTAYGLRSALGSPLVFGLLLVAALAVGSMSGCGGSAKLAVCENNLRQINLVLHMYREDNADYLYPPLSSTGDLVPDAKALTQEYLTDPSITQCPGAPNSGEQIQAWMDDNGYWYVGGYMLPDAEHVADFVEMHRRVMQEGGNFAKTLSIPDSYRSVRRTRAGYSWVLITDINNPAAGSESFNALLGIPIVIENPQNHGGRGGHVLFYDPSWDNPDGSKKSMFDMASEDPHIMATNWHGNVRFMKYPGEFPMTPEVIGALTKLAEEH